MRANFSFQQRWSNREKKLTSSQKQLVNWKKKHMKQWQPRSQKRGRNWGEHSVCYSRPPETASGPLGKEGNSDGANCWPRLEQSWKSGEVKGVSVHSTHPGKEGLPKRALEVQRSPFPPCPVREGPAWEGQKDQSLHAAHSKASSSQSGLGGFHEALSNEFRKTLYQYMGKLISG